MMSPSGSAEGTLGDRGSTVAVSVPVSETPGELDVQSTTTSLMVRDSSGNTLLSVPQLWSTVDSGKTTWKVEGGMATITLHKLDPREHWRSLEYQVRQLDQSVARPVQTADRADPGLPGVEPVMQQHVEQKAVVQAESKPPAEPKEGSSEAAMAARDQVKQLFQAAVAGDVEHMQQVAPTVSAEGLDAVKDGNGRTALHFAAQAGQARAAEYLLDQEGIDVNAQDDSGETALGLAAGAGHLDVVQLLLQHGADMSLPQDSRPQPLHRAAAEGSTAVVQALLKHGGSVNAPTEMGPPLLWAAGSGQHSNVVALLAAGADPNAQNTDGVTAMLMAGAAGDTATVEALAAKGADANVAAQGGVTPLHAAAENGGLSVIKALLKAGADPNAEDADSGAKPIHAAASAGNAEILQHLLPLTKPREGEDWSVEGLMADTSSAGDAASPSTATDQAYSVPEPEDYDPEKAAGCKREGDEAFVGKRFAQAVSSYTESLQHDTKNHLVWANRSAAHLRQGNAESSLSDARTARSLNPKYVKAWYREGEAAKALQQYEDAALAYYEAYSLEPDNKELAQAFQAAIAAGKEQYAQNKAVH